MRRLIIVGAGGFGREVFAASQEAIGYGKDFIVGGFLDARAEALQGFSGYGPILGTPESYSPKADDVFITAVGNLKTRRHLVDVLTARGAVFQSVIHQSASIGPNVSIGAGSFIAQGAVLTADITIGAHTVIFQYATIGHDSCVGDFCHIYAQCAVGGGVKVGAGVSIYPHASIVPRRTIGPNATVGIASAVFLNVPENQTVFGNPARPIDVRANAAY